MKAHDIRRGNWKFLDIRVVLYERVEGRLLGLEACTAFSVAMRRHGGDAASYPFSVHDPVTLTPDARAAHLADGRAVEVVDDRVNRWLEARIRHPDWALRSWVRLLQRGLDAVVPLVGRGIGADVRFEYGAWGGQYEPEVDELLPAAEQWETRLEAGADGT